MFQFEALFLGSVASQFKDKETNEMVPYFNLSFLPVDKKGMPLSLKANEDGYKAYQDLEPLDPVVVKFSVNKDGVLRVIG